MNITKKNLEKSFEENVDSNLRNQISPEALEKGLAGMAGAIEQGQRTGRGR